MRHLIVVFLTVLLAAACAPTPTLEPDAPVVNPPINESPTQELPAMPSYAPQPNDVNFSRENVFIQEMGLLIRESYPPQITLGISGDLPTPCHQLRAEIAPPDSRNKINVDVYTVTDPNMLCTQVLKPFQENIDLGTFPSGHYSVWVNGELAGEFDS
jgi:hypothetical protein